ncbi:MAG: ferredoxin [Solirubrobacteraceae bacterium]
MSEHIRVNPIACEAHGMCAELLPEMIALDEWGYPIVDGRPVPLELLDLARRAAQACPTFALMLERRKAPAAAPRERYRSGVKSVRRVPRRPDESPRRPDESPPERQAGAL